MDLGDAVSQHRRAIVESIPNARRSRLLKHHMPRALKNLDISLGVAVIPVQLFTPTNSQGVAFHLLHAKCGSQIQMRRECPSTALSRAKRR
jgi:hypothetical protein